MIQSRQYIGILLALWAVRLATAAPTSAPANDAPALLAKIRALKAPSVDPNRQDDPKYVQLIVQATRQWVQERHQLIHEFFTRFPDDPQAQTLVSDSLLQMARMGMRQEVMDATAGELARNHDPKFRADILFARAQANFFPERSDQAAGVVEDFVRAAPQDERGAQLLMLLAGSEKDPQKKTALYHRLVDRHATTHSGQAAKGMLRQSESIGQPFNLTFADAISGREISVQRDLKGKVVVIEFWATWCAPCVAEMPQYKELYAKYRDQGVEFIGVSLDVSQAKGGLKALRDFAAKNEIHRPQYYLGNQWESEFSTNWGITEIPTAFIIDKEGKLVSVEARGQLEKLIPELLARNEKTARAEQ